MRATLSSLFRSGWVKLLVAVVAVGLLVGVPVVALGQRPPGPTGPPTVVPGKPPPAVDRAILERAAALDRTDGPTEVDLGEGFKGRAVAGPRTRGSTIEVAGKKLKLPPDAELNGIILEVLPAGTGPTIETPAFAIVRGKSNAVVSIKTGQYAVERCLADFQFLVDELGPAKLVGEAKPCP